MNMYKFLVFVGVGYIIYKNRHKILSAAKQIGIVTVVPDPTNAEWTTQQ